MGPERNTMLKRLSPVQGKTGQSFMVGDHTVRCTWTGWKDYLGAVEQTW